MISHIQQITSSILTRTNWRSRCRGRKPNKGNKGITANVQFIDDIRKKIRKNFIFFFNLSFFLMDASSMIISLVYSFKSVASSLQGLFQKKLKNLRIKLPP